MECRDGFGNVSVCELDGFATSSSAIRFTRGLLDELLSNCCCFEQEVAFYSPFSFTQFASVPEGEICQKPSQPPR
jgi:hypothetical protein